MAAYFRLTYCHQQSHYTRLNKILFHNLKVDLDESADGGVVDTSLNMTELLKQASEDPYSVIEGHEAAEEIEEPEQEKEEEAEGEKEEEEEPRPGSGATNQETSEQKKQTK